VREWAISRGRERWQFDEAMKGMWKQEDEALSKSVPILVYRNILVYFWYTEINTYS